MASLDIHTVAHLCIDDRVTEFQERESVEQGRKNVQEDLARNVPDISPVSGKRPLEQLLRLSPVRCCILAGPVDILGHRLALALLLDPVDVFRQFRIFLAFFPNLGPVFVSWASDDIDCPFTAHMSVSGRFEDCGLRTHLGLAPFSIFFAPFDSKYVIIVSPCLPIGPLYTVLPPRASNSKSSNWNKSSELG